MSDLEPPDWFDAAPPPSGPSTGAPARQSRGNGAQVSAPSTDLTVAYDQAAPETKEMMEVLRNSLYPGATWGSIAMVLSYCKVHELDPLLKCVHIVPMSVKLPGRNNYEWRDVLMPGIADYRVKASRSGTYVGKSKPIFGPTVEYTLDGRVFEVPEWCEITVRRLVAGIVAEFPAIEYWIENYATAGRDKEAPNAMWMRRARGQLAKCTEAQALRMAFPEFGGAPTAEEMEGKTFIDGIGTVVSLGARPQEQPANVKSLEYALAGQTIDLTVPVNGAHVVTKGDAFLEGSLDKAVIPEPIASQTMPPREPEPAIDEPHEIDPLGDLRGKEWATPMAWVRGMRLHIETIKTLDVLAALQGDPDFAPRLAATKKRDARLAEELEDALQDRATLLTQLPNG